ncbi:hypothetical protein LWI29_037671 [Acer saccharum]|uniref:HAT C-terminal dimerisation domain-containing protein n=1 Tax=Acer saccharum TaxID=4024 RepID=A0AA39RQ87_ACESA|nr:hypothetical protein LWI29_037671 [Acer saccharum]
MASGSGSGSGGDGSRNFIEDRFGSNQPSPPIPPEINPEFDGLNPAYNTPNVYENVSNPPPPSDDFFAGKGDAEEEKPAKSDLFKVHMKKISFDGLEVDILDCCDSVKTLLYELYDEYVKIYGQSLNVPVSQPQPTSRPSGASSSSSKFKLQGLGDLLFSQRSKKLKTSSSSSASEVDRYLEDEHKFPDDKFSLQDWWKSHQQDYPILAIIAKQILGTPVSTVAVEQEFSAGGNILDPRRSVMCPQSLEMQACVDDWTKAKYRQQELQPEIVNDFFEGDQTTGTEGSE